jgi:periplasmic protein TonB
MNTTMSSTIKGIRPPVIHHEHSPWPQRYATLICVVGLHVGVGIGLLAMKLSAPVEIEPPVLNVQWIPTQQAPEQNKPQEKPKEPPKKKPEPVQKSVPVQQPTKPVEAPVIQAPAIAAAAAEAPQTPHAPPAPPAPAPQPQAVQASAPPIDANLKTSANCTGPRPVYPSASKTLGEEGAVMLRIQVDEQGRPLRVEVDKSSGHTRLDRSARETVASSWTCPLRRGNQNSDGWMRASIVFEL